MKTRTPEDQILFYLDEVIELTNKFISYTIDITELGYDKNIIAVTNSIYTQLIKEDIRKLCIDFDFIFSKKNLNSATQWLPTLQSFICEYEQQIKINSENCLNILTALEPAIRKIKETPHTQNYIECLNVRLKLIDDEFRKLVVSEQQNIKKASGVLQITSPPTLSIFKYSLQIFKFIDALKNINFLQNKDEKKKFAMLSLPKFMFHRISFFSTPANIVRLGCASKELNNVTNDGDIWKNQLSLTFNMSSIEIEKCKQQNETYKDLFKRMKNQKTKLGIYSGLFGSNLLINSSLHSHVKQLSLHNFYK